LTSPYPYGKQFLFNGLVIFRPEGVEMKKETKEMLNELMYYSGLGFSVALCIFSGLFIGLFLDRWLGTKPWFMFIFLAIGIAAGFRNLYLAMQKMKKM